MLDDLVAGLRVTKNKLVGFQALVLGSIIAALIEGLLYMKDIREEYDRKIHELRTEVNKLKTQPGPGNGPAVVAATSQTCQAPIGGVQTVTIGSGATEYFGLFTSTTRSSAGGYPVGPLSRSVSTLYAQINAAVASGTQAVITAFYTPDQVNYTQLGTGSITYIPSSALFQSAPLVAGGATVTVPANAWLQFTVVTTGAIGAESFGLFVG